MSSLKELRDERIKKLELLKEQGVNPYPISSKRKLAVSDAVEQFSKLSKKKSATIMAGRVLAVRKQGGLAFVNFNDGTGTFQALLKKNDLKKDQFALFADTVDIGDFVEFKGTLFETQRNDKSIEVKEWSMLAKSLRPLPDKWHGLQDVDERFRKRYLDTLMSVDVKQRFITRSKIITQL